VIILRLFRTVTGVIAIVLVIGGFAVVGYQYMHLYRHGVWTDLRLVYLWHWTGVDPSVANRLGAQRFWQWPLWVCLIGPGILAGWLSGACGRWLREKDEARQGDAAH
jgi:hypothetical protein